MSSSSMAQWTMPTAQVRSQADEERAGREDATAAVMKMQSIITAVRNDMVEAQLASDQYASPLSLCAALKLPFSPVAGFTTSVALLDQGIIPTSNQVWMKHADPGCGRAQEALEDERTARVEAEALAERLRQQLATLRDAQSQQQRSSQERLQALQTHLQSLASRVVRTYLYLDGCLWPF